MRIGRRGALLRQNYEVAKEALARVEDELHRERTKKAFEDFTGKSARFLEAGLDLAGLDDLVASPLRRQAR